MHARLDHIRSSIQKLIEGMMAPVLKSSKGTNIEEAVTAANDALKEAVEHLGDAIAIMVDNKNARLEDEEDAE